MSILEAGSQEERHRETFSTGSLLPEQPALIISLIWIIRCSSPLLSTVNQIGTWRRLFPLYSLFGFVVLHVAMYAINIYF
ncbi:unnamed protein product [Rhodiola kirilowii]